MQISFELCALPVWFHPRQLSVLRRSPTMLLLLLYFILGTSNASQDVINTGGKTIHVFSERGRNDRLNRPNSFLIEDPDKNIPGSWPWAVSIGYQDGWNWLHACDGVIVTNGSVVTSAACLAHYEEGSELTVETLSVRAGDNHLKFNDFKIQLANVSRHEKHPGFNASVWPMEHYEDVAVLFLLPSLNFTRSVKPIYIPTLEEGITTTKAKDTDITLTACGWGGKFKVGGRKLQDAVITSLEDNFCNFVYRGDGLSKNLTDEILCAANVIDLSGTCRVGQGSGIFRLYHDPANHTNNRYVLTGILSSHIKSDGNITCGSPHTPNVFVRVASRSILSFLYKTIYNIESDSSATDAPAQPSIELDQESTLEPYYESCGVNNIIDHILAMESSGTNGQQETATWPWLVPLLVNRTIPMNFEFICAGTILTEDKILTAAHCFDGIYDEMMIKVRAGDVFLNNAIDDSMVQEVYIFKSDVTIHPNYTENRYFDLAILHLRSKFNFTTKVRPVCLLSPQEAATITKNNETLLSILISGWGRDSLGRYGQDLWQIVAEIFSKAICDNTYRDSSHIRNLLPNLFTEDVLCAGDPAGDSGTCHGDSGGGAVHFDQKRRRYVARAVVSGSKHGQCGSGFAPNIYARLADAIVNNWIFSQINFTAPTDMVFEDGNYTFVSGSTVTYNCSTTSNPVSQISWKLTDHLNNTLLFQESSSVERFGQNWMKTSRITFVFPRDSGSVEAKCTGKNVMGHLSATAVLSAGYYMTYNEGPGCGTASITSSSECGIVAASLGYNDTVEVGSWDTAPPGCLVGHPTDGWKSTFFNNHTSGQTGRNIYRSVCHKAPNCTENSDWSTPCGCGSSMCLSEHVYCLKISSIEAEHQCLSRVDLGHQLQKLQPFANKDSKLKYLEEKCSSLVASPGETLQSGCHKPEPLKDGAWMCSEDGGVCHLNCQPGFRVVHSNKKTFTTCFHQKWFENPNGFLCEIDPDYRAPRSILIESSGQTAEHQGARLGYFDESSEKLNQRPVYIQRGGDTFLYYHGDNGEWYAGKTLGAASGRAIRINSVAQFPPSTGWSYYGDEWIEAAGSDDTLKVTIDPPALTGCDNIQVQSTGPAGTVQSKSMGLYKEMAGQWLNGRKVYHNGYAYLRVITGTTTWSMGIEKDSGGRIQSGRATSCPCQEESGPNIRWERKWWVYWDGNKWVVDESITVTCV